jgi:hypothetical protein
MENGPMGLAFHSPVPNSLFSVPGSAFLPHWSGSAGRVRTGRIKYTVKKTISQALDRDPTATTSSRDHGMECADGR